MDALSSAALHRMLPGLRRILVGEAATPAASRVLVRRIGGFAILSLLGTGRLGEVHRAWQIDPGRPVALRLIRPESVEAAGGFLLEGRCAAFLFHPGLVPIVDVACIRGRVHLASELVVGTTLDRRTFPPGRAAQIVRDAADALHRAHQMGVVHRGLSPRNLMLDGEGRVRVLDIGLARWAQRASLRPADFAFLAPEQLRGSAGDVRSDVYALGATLRALSRRLPEPLETAARTATEKRPDRRFSTARDFADVLDGILRERAETTSEGFFDRLARWIRRS